MYLDPPEITVGARLMSVASVAISHDINLTLRRRRVCETEVGCLAHARRKFHELWVNHGSQVGEGALKFVGELYDIEREARELKPDERTRTRKAKSAPVANEMQQSLRQQRARVPNGSATSKAIDCSLRRWDALTRFIDDGDLPAETIGRRARSVPLPLAGRTGCSPVRFGPASAPLRS
jgi:hypothetical protein